MLAADDGISPLMERSARLRQPLMVWCTWYMEMAPKKIYTVCGKLKECARESLRELCAWDSGLVIAMLMAQLTRTRAGIQCPGFTWKKYHPHRLKTY